MRNNLFIIGLLLCLPCFIFMQQEYVLADNKQVQCIDDPNFNGINIFNAIKWEMTIDEIQNTVSGLKLVRKDKYKNYLSKKAYLYGCDVDLDFIFFFDKLYVVRYIFSKKHAEPNKYIDDYNNIQSFLENQIGLPDGKKPVYLWKNRRFKNNILKHGQAIMNGDLIIYSTWIFSGLADILFDAEHCLEKEKHGIEHKIRFMYRDIRKILNKYEKMK